MIQRIERVDEIPLMLNWLMQMGVHEVTDSIYKPHTNWDGLTYGKLAALFVTYVVHLTTGQKMVLWEFAW